MIKVLDLGEHRTIFYSVGATALRQVLIPDTADFQATMLTYDPDVTPERGRSHRPAHGLEGAALVDIYVSAPKCISCNGVPWILCAF